MHEAFCCMPLASAASCKNTRELVEHIFWKRTFLGFMCNHTATWPQLVLRNFAPQLFAFNNAYPFHYLLNSIATSVEWKCVLMYAHQIVVLWSSSNALADHHIKTVPHYHITALQCVLKAAAAAAVFLLFLLLLHQHVAHFLAIKSSLFNYRN